MCLGVCAEGWGDVYVCRGCGCGCAEGVGGMLRVLVAADEAAVAARLHVSAAAYGERCFGRESRIGAGV